MKIDPLTVYGYGDSQLIVNQLKGMYTTTTLLSKKEVSRALFHQGTQAPK